MRVLVVIVFSSVCYVFEWGAKGELFFVFNVLYIHKLYVNVGNGHLLLLY